MNTESTTTHHPLAGNGGANPQLFQGDVGGVFPLLAPETSHADEIERIATTRREQVARLLSLRESILNARVLRIAVEDKQLAAIATELGEDAPVATLESGRARPGPLPPFDGAKVRARSGNAASPRPKKAGRLARRSDEQIDALVDKVVALVKKAPEGLRAEAIREALHLEAKELPRVFARAKERKVLKSKGLKRATTYLARG